MCTVNKLIVEIGVSRSGTTFLSNVLAAHPAVVKNMLVKYVFRHGHAWRNHDCLSAEDATPRIRRYVQRRFYDLLKKSGKERLLVCVQANTLQLAFVNEIFPDCKIVHILRDGREVACSQEFEWTVHVSPPGRGPLNRMFDVPITDLPAYAWEYLASVWHRFSGATYRYSWGPKIKDWKKLKASLDRLEFCAVTWRECVIAARRVGLTLPKDRYYEIRFEDLIRRTDDVIPPLLEFLELPPAKEVDEFIHKQLDHSRAGHWLKEAAPERLDRIAPHIGCLCRELGYV